MNTPPFFSLERFKCLVLPLSLNLPPHQDSDYYITSRLLITDIFYLYIFRVEDKIIISFIVFQVLLSRARNRAAHLVLNFTFKLSFSE